MTFNDEDFNKICIPENRIINWHENGLMPKRRIFSRILSHIHKMYNNPINRVDMICKKYLSDNLELIASCLYEEKTALYDYNGVSSQQIFWAVADQIRRRVVRPMVVRDRISLDSRAIDSYSSTDTLIYHKTEKLRIAPVGQPLSDRISRDVLSCSFSEAMEDYSACFASIDALLFKIPAFTLTYEMAYDTEKYDEGDIVELNYKPVTCIIRANRMACDNGSIFDMFCSGDSYSIYVLPSGNPKYFNVGGWHPHVGSDNDLCQGNSADTVRNLLRAGLISDAISVISNVVSTYNDNSPFRHIYDVTRPLWLRKCGVCHKDIETRDHLYRCSKCGRSYHRSCLRDGNIRICDKCLGHKPTGVINEFGEFIKDSSC